MVPKENLLVSQEESAKWGHCTAPGPERTTMKGLTRGFANRRKNIQPASSKSVHLATSMGPMWSPPQEESRVPWTGKHRAVRITSWLPAAKDGIRGKEVSVYQDQSLQPLFTDLDGQ